jgi:hypothetical protein
VRTPATGGPWLMIYFACLSMDEEEADRAWKRAQRRVDQIVRLSPLGRPFADAETRARWNRRMLTSRAALHSAIGAHSAAMRREMRSLLDLFHVRRSMEHFQAWLKLELPRVPELSPGFRGRVLAAIDAERRDRGRR